MSAPAQLIAAAPETDGATAYEVAWPQAIPLNEYRLVGEPPRFRAQTLLRDGNVRLLRVVMEQEDTHVRTAYHLAIEDAGATVIAQAIPLAWDTIGASAGSPGFDVGDRTDVCDSRFDGFIWPVRIRAAPLRIDYEIESPFLTGDRDERRPGECTNRSHATWRSGKGFEIGFDRGACSQTRFRAAQVAPDGTIVPRVLKLEPQ